MGYPWPESVVEKARALAADGYSASQAAAMIPKMTRSGILGLAHRRGFQFFGRDGKYTKEFKPLAIRIREPSLNRLKKSKLVRPKQVIVDEPPRIVTLMDLGLNDCKFPIGVPGSKQFGYCGAKQLTFKPYCPHHCRIAYETPQERIHAREESRGSGPNRRTNGSFRYGRTFDGGL